MHTHAHTFMPMVWESSHENIHDSSCFPHAHITRSIKVLMAIVFFPHPPVMHQFKSINSAPAGVGMFDHTDCEFYAAKTAWGQIDPRRTPMCAICVQHNEKIS